MLQYVVVTMTKYRLIPVTALLVLATAAFSLGQSLDRTGPLNIGDRAPLSDKALMTTDGSTVSLESVKGVKGVLVVFSCNTCPWVEKWEDRYHTVAKAAKDIGVEMILVNSNEALRDGDESVAAMKERAERMKYSFPYAVDESAALADAFGANRTPEVFLFDADLKLIYHGAIDDNARDASAVESPFLLNAIAAYAAGSVITPNDTKSIGCTIKRKR